MPPPDGSSTSNHLTRSRVALGRVAEIGAIAALTLAVGCAAGTDPAGAGDPAVTSPPTTPPPSIEADLEATEERTGAATTPPTTSPPTTTLADEPGPAPRARLGEPVMVAEQPVDVVAHPTTGALYVPERLGTIRVFDGDALSPLLLDVRDRVEPGMEEGLLGLVFSPDGGHAFLNKASEGWTSITQYAVTADGGFDLDSRRTVLEYEQPFDNHNGGQLLFGPDGYLYVFLGDGGFVGDPDRRALDLSTLHGSILRIDPSPDGDEAYRIPDDNPFVGVDGARAEIWSYGLRNPWRASFDPDTGDLWVPDVGDFAREEINVAWADEGAGRAVSFGWSAWEGTLRFNEDQPPDGHEPPFFEYEHGEEGCSITAGERYRGDAIEHLHGWFVFADFCSGVVRALEVTPDRAAGRLVELDVVPFPVSITAGPDGELFVVSFDGPIHVLR